MNKGIFLLLALLILLPLSVNAEFYRWTDDEGVIHVTDDPTNIPQKYWEEGKFKKEEVKPAPSEREAEQPAMPTAVGQPAEEKAEMYGDQPLDWWKSKFEELKTNISDSEGTLEREKNFISVYEGGLRYGKVYSRDEISQYENYKNDISSLEEKIKNIKSELVELQRKATTYGVPRNIRE